MAALTVLALSSGWHANAASWLHPMALVRHVPMRQSVPNRARDLLALYGESDYDGEEDEWEEALARYSSLGILDEKWKVGAAKDDHDDDDDTTTEMMLELSMRHLDELARAQQGSEQDASMQAAVAAAIDAAAAAEARGVQLPLNVSWGESGSVGTDGMDC